MKLLANENVEKRIVDSLLSKIIRKYEKKLVKHFTVLSEDKIRIRPL